MPDSIYCPCGCGEPMPEPRRANRKYWARDCAVRVAHARQNARIFGPGGYVLKPPASEGKRSEPAEGRPSPEIPAIPGSKG